MTLLTPERWTTSPSGLIVPAAIAPARPAKPIGIDLFAGCGGFSLGFVHAGWHVAAAVEWDLVAAATYLCNQGSADTVVHVDDPDRAGAPDGFGGAGTGWIATSDHRNCRLADDHGIGKTPAAGYCPACGWKPGGECSCARCCDPLPVDHFYICDVRALTGEQILADLGLERGEVGCVFGGPPCQGFSAAGQRNVMDPRNSLIFEFARLVLEIQPKTMAMENVPGILSMVTPEGVPVVDAFCRVLSDGGFAEYDALRRSLTSHPDARAALRSTTPPRRRARTEPADDGQLDLLGEEVGAP